VIDGAMLGSNEGTTDGCKVGVVGLIEGFIVGFKVGQTVGSKLGAVGEVDGLTVGTRVGIVVGLNDGPTVVSIDVTLIGSKVGANDLIGPFVGARVGYRVG
jgi:hypothetical protein